MVSTNCPKDKRETKHEKRKSGANCSGFRVRYGLCRARFFRNFGSITCRTPATLASPASNSLGPLGFRMLFLDVLIVCHARGKRIERNHRPSCEIPRKLTDRRSNRDRRDEYKNSFDGCKIRALAIIAVDRRLVSDEARTATQLSTNCWSGNKSSRVNGQHSLSLLRN